MKIPSGRNPHILLIPIPISYLSTLTEVHFLPVYGIISLCLIGRIQVASESAIDTSWFWSTSRACSIDSSTALWACLKIIMYWRGIELTPGISPGFRFKFACPDGKTGVTHSRYRNITENIYSKLRSSYNTFNILWNKWLKQ